MTKGHDEAEAAHIEAVLGQELQRVWVESFIKSIEEAQAAYTFGTWKSGTVIGGAVRWDTNKGHYCGPGWDEGGRPLDVEARFRDSQAENAAPDSALAGLVEESKELVVRQDCAAIAQDEGARTCDRLLALREWMRQDGDAASSFLADEISKPNLQEDWRNSLVFAAEDACFATSDLQGRVCDALRRIALALRMSSQPDIETVVWSALRRFGSLLDPNSIDELREFLEPVGYVDTRLVALQAVLHIFEREPPAALDSLQRVGDRAWDIASKLFDPDVFRPGETSSVASHAVLVLCVCADERALPAVDAMKRLGRRWITRRLRERLRELQRAWCESDAGVETCPAYVLVEGVLANLD